MTPSPRIWLVLGDKLGDNTQLTMIANSLDLPFEIKHLVPKEKYRLGKPRFRASLEHLDLESSDPLTAPWPDLVITAGRRHSMAALWIKNQSPATRLVLLGRPRRWIERFDLVITLPQYQLPDLPQVMHLSLPLMRTDTQAVSAAAENWKSRLDALPKPVIAVLIGSATRPFRFDAAVTDDLVTQCNKLQDRYGGSLYFSTSRRTSPQIIAALKARLPEGAQLYQWHQNSTDNPYLALLELADYFVITGDSVSMMIEVADRQKPLAIFQLPVFLQGRIWQSVTQRFYAEPTRGITNRLLRLLGKLLYNTGVAGFSRDLTQIHTMLASGGFAVFAGEPFRKPTGTLPDELNLIRERILTLLPAMFCSGKRQHGSNPTG
jgi:mitochondrial fission protein ELM1